MRAHLIALGALTLGACLSPQDSCQNAIEIDETTGQITLNGGDRCRAMPFGIRPDGLEMNEMVLDESEDMCSPVDFDTVYHVEELKNDLDFGPSDPPEEGETLVDHTDDLEVGAAIQVVMWSGAPFSEGRRTIGPWSRTFLWGVEDTVEKPECLLGR